MTFDPDAYLKGQPAIAPFDPDTYLKKTEPESNVVADAARRFASEAGATGGQVVSGIGSAQAAGTDLIDQAQIAFGRLVGAPEAALDRLKQRQAEQRAKADRELTGKLQRGGGFVTDAAREAYDIDPTRNDTLVAKIAQGAGSLPVAIASGPAAPLTVASMMGQQGKEDAAKALARRGITDPEEIRKAETAAFALNAPIGAVSEKLLGMPALLRSAEQMIGKTAVARIARQAGLGFAREGAQEGIEQGAQNVIAKDVVGYDPERDRSEGVVESTLLGGVIGGPTGAAFQGVQELDARSGHKAYADKLDTAKNIPESQKTLLLQQDQLLRGLRPAQMFPAGTTPLPLPEGMKKVENDRGVFHYNPTQINGDAILSASRDGKENEILGLGPVSKPAAQARAAATGEKLVAVAERAADGTEIKTTIGTTGTAPAQVAALEASKSPGSTVKVEEIGKTIVERQRAAQAAVEQKAREEKLAEDTRRAEAQARRDGDKLRFEETLLAADALEQDRAAAWPAVNGALKSLSNFVDDSTYALTQQQREAALKRIARLQPRAEQLKVGHDAAADARFNADKAAAAAAEKAKQEKVRADQARIDAIDATGRDPSTNRIVQIENLTDDDLADVGNDLESNGLTPQSYEAELMRRERQAAEKGNRANFTLRDLFVGKKSALNAAGLTAPLRLPTPKTETERGGLGGELKTLRESSGAFAFFQNNAPALDRMAQTLRGLGFKVQTENDVVELVGRAFGGEDVRPETEGEVEFAAAARRAEIITRDITAEQLESPLAPVTAAAAPTESPAQLRNLLRPILQAASSKPTAGLGPIKISNKNIGHLFNDTRTPQDWQALRVLPQLLQVAKPVGKPYLDGATRFSRAIAALTIDSELVPVRFTLRHEADGIYLHGYDVTYQEKLTEKLKGKAPEEAPGTQTDDSANPLTVRDLLPGVKAEANGTSTAAFATDTARKATAPAPVVLLSDAEVARLRAAHAKALGPRMTDIDLRVGLLADLLEQEGYPKAAANLRANNLGEAEAVVAARRAPQHRAEIVRLRQEQAFLLVSAKAAAEGKMTGLIAHELAHRYWDTLPEDAKSIERASIDQALKAKSGPLFDAEGNKRTNIAITAEELRAAGRGAALDTNPDLVYQEYFAELTRIENERYLGNRVDATSAPAHSRRLIARLRQWMQEVFDAVRRTTGQANLSREGFREWLAGASQEQTNRTALAYATRQGPKFATTQSTFDMGGMALGLDLPNAIRNLTPRWQDKVLRFDSNLDKALYYAGGEGKTETRNATIEHLQRETSLSPGQIATLARDLRQKLAPLARNTASEGTLRVPPQMQAAARQLTGVQFATSKAAKLASPAKPAQHSSSENQQQDTGATIARYVDGNGTTTEKRAEAIEQISQLQAIANNSKLDEDNYLQAAGGRDYDENATGSGTESDKALRNRVRGLAEKDAKNQRARNALIVPELALEAALADGDRISSIIPELIANPRRSWDIRGAVIETPSDLLALTQVLRTPYAETAKIILVNNKNEVVHAEIISIGTTTNTLFAPSHLAQVLARAPKTTQPYGIIISHNHPSGNPTPSAADHRMTRKFTETAQSSGNYLLDHVVTNGKRYYSFKETGQLPEYVGSITDQSPAARGADADPDLSANQARAPWEVAAREDLKEIGSPYDASVFLATARQVAPDAMHVIYVNTRNQMVSFERIPNAATLTEQALRQRLFKAMGREGATGFFVDMPETLSGSGSVMTMRMLRTFATQTDFILLDVTGKFQDSTHDSARTLGILAEPDQTRYSGVAEDPNSKEGFTRDELPSVTDAELRTEHDRVVEKLTKQGKQLPLNERQDLQRLRSQIQEEAAKRGLPPLDAPAPATTPAASNAAALKANPPAGVKTAAALERKQDAQATRLSEAAKEQRHPAAVGATEPGEAWASVAKMTEKQLAEEREKIAEYFNSDDGLYLADIEKALLHGRTAALKAEIDRRADPVGRATKVTALPKVDRKEALKTELDRGRRLRDDGLKTGNDTAANEGTRIVKAATARLDEEYPGWDAKAPTVAKSATVAPTTPATKPAPAALATQDDGRNLPPPAPPEPPENGAPRPDDAAPDRGRARAAFGHSAYTPNFLERTTERLRSMAVGFRGAIPELPAFPALAAKTDRFIRDQGPAFYNNLKAFYRTLSSANDYVQRTAEEQVDAITGPLMKTGVAFDATAYAQLKKRQEQARRLKAEGKLMPAGAGAELDALQSQLEAHPYVLFNKLVYFMDLDWRGRNLKDSEGNPIKLPDGLNQTEIDNELARLGGLIAASPHAQLIETAFDRHMALVKQTAEDLKQRDLLAAQHLDNPYYFPHLTLEITRGDKVIERELRPERVRVGTEADFRGYLQEPTGSLKPIESDYVRAVYYHLVQVGAHNLKADAIRDHARSYDVMEQVKDRAKVLSKQRGRSVSWEEVFHSEYAPAGYVLYGTDSRDAFPSVMVDRDKLARRLGEDLTSADLHEQLKELGVKGIKLLPEDLKETLIQGQRETWIVPARVAEALRGIADRQKKTSEPIESAIKKVNGAWKGWKLFMPQNHIRYEYGNIVADLEKLFSASPRTFKYLGQSAKEMRAFFQGEAPSADLRAALKDGVINAITAQEMNQLQRLRAFEKFQTVGERITTQLKKRSSSALYQPITNMVGLGDLSSVELSAFREGVTRYANYLANLEAIRNNARPDYAGAYWRDIEAIGDSRPGANDKAQRQAAQISKATFGDYGDLSTNGQYLRDKLIPFYSWIEVNFKYHANLLRNLRDQVRGDIDGGTGNAAATAARVAGARAGGFVLRLALPYAAVMLWNAMGPHGVDDDDLSEEDRRRFHIRLGKDENGKPQVVYTNTALADVTKWFSGPKFAQAATAWVTGKTDFVTAIDSWAKDIPGDLANNTIGSAGPVIKLPATAILKKNFFPDVLDARTIPDYDMRRAIISQMTDDFTADRIEATVNKDYLAPKDLGTWAKQLILQVRQRDPESWAFYGIKDKAAAFVEQRTGQSRDMSYNAPDQQVLRNFRKAIYQGDPETAAKFYLRLLDLGYTSERFTASIRAQEPLAGVPKDLRREFVASLSEGERAQLERAYQFYVRMSTSKGTERALFPRKEWGERGQQYYQANPRVGVITQTMQRTEAMADDELVARAKWEMRASLQRN